MVSYKVRYNWALSQGKIKVHSEYEGSALREMVSISLDEVEEYALAVSSHYRLDYDYVLNMYYSDVSVLYAKIANEQAFKSYNDYISLNEEGRSKFVMDYGEPKPYSYQILTPEKQQANIESEAKNSLKETYRQGGRLND